MTNAIDPGHYKGFSNGAQVIDISENLTSNAGQAVQYIARSCRLDGANKGDQIEDLTKAAWFINREVQRLAALEGVTPKPAATVCDCDLDAGRICAKCTSAEPESWATWQEVPDGVHYYSQPTGAGPWVNRLGVRMVPEDDSVSCYSPNSMAEFAPFVRKLS